MQKTVRKRGRGGSGKGRRRRECQKAERRGGGRRVINKPIRLQAEIFYLAAILK